MTPSPLRLLALVAVLVPGVATAHGVRTEVERRGDEVAVRARYASGRPLADARYDVTSPALQGRAFAEGRTDREGWVVFKPDVPGVWKVRVVDATGHGRVVDVDVAPPPPAAVTAPLPTPAPSPAERAAERRASPGTFLRTAGGVGLVALVFGGLYAAGRRRRAAGR